MTLDILVPHYTEADQTVRRLLDSIALQIGVDFGRVGVTIANDGTSLGESVTDGLPFSVEVLDRPHGGVSATRNALLDHTRADYVMLCDCDDSFATAFGLLEVFGNMPYEVMVPPFWKEHEGGALELRPKDPYLVHGKCFSVQFLRANGIRWCDRLTFSGDNYFLWQALLLGEAKYTKNAFYVWRYNEGSVCRSTPDHFQRTYYRALETMGENVDDFVRRGREDLARKMMLLLTYDAYYFTQMGRWEERWLDDAAIVFARCWGRHANLVTSAPTEASVQVYSERRTCYQWQGPAAGYDGVPRWVAGFYRRGKECAASSSATGT